MNNAVADFKSLSIAERIQLVEDIWDSIAAETSDEIELSSTQKAEIEVRLEAHRVDSDSAIPWEQVREELFGQYPR